MASDLIRAWKPVRARKTRQLKKPKPRFDSFEMEKTPASRPILPVAMVPMAMMPAVMTPMPVMPVPVMAPMMTVVAPVHLGGQLPGIILNRGGGAGTGQR
jgi:hypothetical protein